MGALNLPSASDLERLTRRIRSVSQRLEGIEDALDRLDERLGRADGGGALEQRLTRIEASLERLENVGRHRPARAASPPPRSRRQRTPPCRPSRTRTKQPGQPRRARRAAARRHAAPRSSMRAPRRQQHVSETISAHPARSPRRAASANRVAVSISTASAPCGAPVLLGARAAVVEEVGGDDRPVAHAAAGGRERAVSSSGSAPTRPAAPERPAGPVGGERLAGHEQVAQRRARRPARRTSRPAPGVRAPRSASSAITIAALGPPMPVLWIVSGSPSRAVARVAPQPAVVVEHLRLVEQRLGQQQRAARVAGQQHALGQRRGRVQVDGGHGRAALRAVSAGHYTAPR